MSDIQLELEILRYDPEKEVRMTFLQDLQIGFKLVWLSRYKLRVVARLSSFSDSPRHRPPRSAQLSLPASCWVSWTLGGTVKVEGSGLVRGNSGHSGVCLLRWQK